MMDHLTLGVCYYPEQWPEDLWEEDLKRVRSCGIEIVRIGDFCWTLCEAQEGQYDFSLIERFLALCEKQGMKVILCTPTAVPPIWMSERYPQILNARCDGTLLRHGMRRHATLNSEIYLTFVKGIVTALAKQFADHPCVIGWQIDNELNCEISEYYSEADDQAFRVYLQEKYKTLEAFNEAMGTIFWNQTYTAWEQVHLKRITVSGGEQPAPDVGGKAILFAQCSTLCQAAKRYSALRPATGTLHNHQRAVSQSQLSRADEGVSGFYHLRQLSQLRFRQDQARRGAGKPPRPLLELAHGPNALSLAYLWDHGAPDGRNWPGRRLRGAYPRAGTDASLGLSGNCRRCRFSLPLPLANLHKRDRAVLPWVAGLRQPGQSPPSGAETACKGVAAAAGGGGQTLPSRCGVCQRLFRRMGC